ncbi:transglycosylase family protein [Streptomyces sp. NPDC085460]|uniref:transglycosylase family protein n=1 Tax=Streptomyces sp. NPDC085460 TaxID=3365723 RepID=UPI0037D227C1
MTGSAMALPLLAAGSASAADAATWDRVAACESAGQWSANFGNGAYGGLQMTQEAWERHGGLAYAPSPDLASRAQQIAVADKALSSGSTDWATCAPIAGLTNDGKATGVQPGPAVQEEDEGGVAPESNWTGGADTGASSGAEKTAPKPAAPAEKATTATERAEKAEKAAETAAGTATAPAAPAKPTTPAEPTAPATQAPEGTATPPATPAPDASTPAPDASTGTPGTIAPGTTAPDAPVTSPDASKTPADPEAPATPVTPGTDGADVSSATPGTGKHRGEAAPEETDKTDTEQESGRHAAAADKVTSIPVNSDASDAYTVRPGDSLSEIARENDLPGGWDALYDANRHTVGTDPDLILPGQSLELTNPPSEK